MNAPSAWPADVAILIPAYCAAESLKRFLPSVKERVPAGNVLIVDDGSGDGTPSVCAGLGVECVAHRENRGKGAALRTGLGVLAQRGYAFAITMDADGQHAPADLPVFLNALRETPPPAICIGRRDIHPRVMPFGRVLSNAVTSGILSLLTGVLILDSQCGYRAYSLDFIRGITIRYNRFEMESEVILRACRARLPVRFVPIQTVYSSARSHISHLADTWRWVRAVVCVWLELQWVRRPAAGD